MAVHLRKLSSYRRIVIKIGSALLVNQKTGLRSQWLHSLAYDIAALQKTKTEILLVSSGATALGRALLSYPSQALTLRERQSCASVGQIELARAYSNYLSPYGVRTGQILLTLADTEERERYLNARATIKKLITFDVIPIINENDTVSPNAIRYGDNDRLAARIATMIGADLLILLSDIDGLYTLPPDQAANATLIPLITKITPDIEKMACVSPSNISSGGMKTKIDAGKIATNAGTAMLITSGKRFNPLQAIDNGNPVSFFCASKKPMNAWKKWISGHLDPAGKVMIDQGALTALLSGKSLLAAGVILVEGHFLRGDTVAIIDQDRHEIARGLVGYNALETRKIAGCKSHTLSTLLGYTTRTPLIHRNDMVMWNSV